ncbi:hypothetical protein G9A89_015907 [Geosiphon pyriformis]|nr:hypothetical protein G9A89_015907 [Geosiphon pyriformis]
MAHKILFKILSDRIFLACSRFNVLYGDNFSVLKSISTQLPIFTVGSVIEDVLEKNCELWLVLQNMHKAYDSVKRQESVCEYRLNSYFISKNGRPKPITGLSFFFAARAFVNDTIWVGSSQSAIQHILNVASKFFQVNDIFINTDKTVAISINYKVGSLFLVISGSPIAIAKRGESHRYLNIYLLTEGLSKSSLAKAQSDV